MRAATDNLPRRPEPGRSHEPAIVCGVDDSVHARAAARLASALAERLGRPLVLVHAAMLAVPALDVAPSFEEHRLRALDAARRLEKELRRDLRAPQFQMEIRSGPASQCIVAAAAEHRAGMIVVGCRGLGALSATAAGAVTDAVVAAAACPVAIVPPAVAETGAASLNGDSILCGVQRAEDVACARVAQELARGLGCRLVLAHVLPHHADVAALTPAGVVPATLAARGEAPEQAAAATLRRVCGRLPASDAMDLRVCRGNAGRELADLAVAEDAMLVVVGARRWRGPLRAALFGSVSRRLTRVGRRAVVVCPGLPASA
jgi:nucleotide-binding universal stress UspA family protein